MNKYIYTGSEEQLTQHGFKMSTEPEVASLKIGPLVHGLRAIPGKTEEDDDFDEVYIVLTFGYKKPSPSERLFQWNRSNDPDKDIAPFIQDLIDDKLVEVETDLVEVETDDEDNASIPWQNKAISLDEIINKLESGLEGPDLFEDVQRLLDKLYEIKNSKKVVKK